MTLYTDMKTSVATQPESVEHETLPYGFEPLTQPESVEHETLPYRVEPPTDKVQTKTYEIPYTLVVVDLTLANVRNPGMAGVVRGGARWKFNKSNCLDVVTDFLTEYDIDLHPIDIMYISQNLINHRDAYVGHYLFSAV